MPDSFPRWIPTAQGRLIHRLGMACPLLEVGIGMDVDLGLALGIVQAYDLDMGIVRVIVH